LSEEVNHTSKMTSREQLAGQHLTA
jgi:hypothetical protein